MYCKYDANQGRMHLHNKAEVWISLNSLKAHPEAFIHNASQEFLWI